MGKIQTFFIERLTSDDSWERYAGPFDTLDRAVPYMTALCGKVGFRLARYDRVEVVEAKVDHPTQQTESEGGEMSDCNVCIGGYDGDPAEFYRETVRIARKPHKCCECGEPIAVGQKYQYASGRWDGDISTFKTCLLCIEIRESLSCDGTWTFRCLWDELAEVFGTMNTACLSKLKTAAAKAFLLKRWQEWKFRESKP